MIRQFSLALVVSLIAAGCGQQEEVRREVEPTKAPKGPLDSLRAPADAVHGGGGAMPGMPAGHPPMGAAPAVAAPIESTAPKSWVVKQPVSAMIQLEYSLPKAEGDPADGRLTVMAAGGSVEDNVKRWRGQFTGKPEKDSQETLKVDGRPTTLVDLSGTFQEQRGMMGPVTERPNYRMLAAIIEASPHSYFVKAYGPQKTMEAHAADFRKFVESIKLPKEGK